MMGPVAARLPGDRLHLHHGPIDLVIHADGNRRAAYRAAEMRFSTVLEELVAELPRLRSPDGPPLRGGVARRMARATRPHRPAFITPMAAVAGAVADEVLGAVVNAAHPRRAYVNNGGDIAFHLAATQSYRIGLAALDGTDRGRVTLGAADGVAGVATSGCGGRSLSLGIAEAVTVLAPTAAMADAAATMIANAVDLPGHPAIRRDAAEVLDPDSDLGARGVVTGCGPLSRADIRHALARGLEAARNMQGRGLIAAAHLRLQGQTATLTQTPTELANA